MTTLVVAAHGSRDPRSAANTHAVAQTLLDRFDEALDINCLPRTDEPVWQT
jgi:sirohydrochlorin ferrochelatase